MERNLEGQFLLVTLPPTKAQTWFALGVVAAVVVAALVMAPFANIRLPQVATFIPVVLTVITIADLITSALLFSQFFVIGRTALLVLAISYLFTGLMMIPFMLTFPGAFSPTGLLGAGLQSAVYIGLLYRTAASLGVIAYALLRNADRTTTIAQRSPAVLILWGVAAVLPIVCGLTWFIIAEDALLPAIFVSSADTNRAALILQGVFLFSLCAVALALLWAGRRSVLDLWLMVMCCTWLIFLVMSSVVSGARFTLGWYGARCFEVIGTFAVLLVLLSETTALYAKLGRSLARERSAHAAREVAMEAMASGIAHQLKQPLGAIANSANAGLRWMAQTDLDRARASFERVAAEARRAGAAIDGVRALFKQGVYGATLLDVNQLVRQVLATLDSDLRAQRVSVATELHEALPPLSGNRAQLEQVLANLLSNAIEAMQPVTDRDRTLRISTDLIHESPSIRLSVEDSGVGIDERNRERIFEPFFTTKAEGTGIGLFICRAIVQSHGGSVRASANDPHGATFHIALPCA